MPPSPAITPPSANRSPGVLLVWTFAHRRTPSKVMLPRPPGRRWVWPGTEVQLGIGQDVKQPRTDDAERKHPHRQVGDEVGVTATRRPAALGDPDGDGDAEQDARGVGTYGEGAEVSDTPRRTGNALDREQEDVSPGRFREKPAHDAKPPQR